MSLVCLSGCSLMGGNQTSASKYNNENIAKAEPASIPSDIQTTENVDYYTANDLELSVEVNGLFKLIKYFSLDPNNNDLRIYDNMYFYEYDFFQMMPPSSSSDASIYASLSDKNDEQYVEEHRNSAGGDLQIDIKVSGIYKLIFDLKSLKFDIEYKGEITTPKYYTIETCTFQVKTGDQTTEHPMRLDGDVFKVSNVSIGVGSAFLFTAINYVSDYKFTLAEGVENKYACFFMAKQYKNTYAKALIGGTYNVSINAKTYVASLELVTDIESATYFLKQYNDPLAASSLHPYIFKVEFQAERDVYPIPSYYNAASKEVILTPIDDGLFIVSGDMIFLRKAGSYMLEINVLDLTVDAEMLG